MKSWAGTPPGQHDFGVGRNQRLFGCGNVGSPDHQIRRPAGRNAGWNINITDGIRYGNITPYNLSWLSSQKHCQGVSLKGVLLTKPRKLRFCSGKLGFGLPQGQFINLASFKPGPLQGNRFTAGRYGAFRDLNLAVKGSQIEVTIGHLTNHG
jgi:hypothetical protein